jgi:hypothetical protein
MQSADAGTSISSMHVRMEYGILIACSILFRLIFGRLRVPSSPLLKRKKKKTKTNTLEAEKKIVTK